MQKATWGLIALLFGSPFVGELVTGNIPLPVLLAPPVFVQTVLLYGLGAIIIRETAIRWGKGYTTVCLLGLAYGAIEEGLVTKGFFNPQFYAVIAFGMENYGRIGGINMLWALSIMLFHAVYSITIPVALCNAVFGEEGRLTNRTYYSLIALFAVNAAVFNVHLTAEGDHYWPDAGSWWIVCGLIAFLILVARFLPNPVSAKRKPTNSLLLSMLGAAMSALYFIISQGFHNFLNGALVNFIALSLFALLCGWLVSRLSFSSRGIVSMACGWLSPMIVVGVFKGAATIMVATVLLLGGALFMTTNEWKAPTTI
jgi:hypothetical protein